MIIYESVHIENVHLSESVHILEHVDFSNSSNQIRCSIFSEVNKAILIDCGALPLLVKLLHSNIIEVQCNACGCITTLANTGEFLEKKQQQKNKYLGPVVQNIVSLMSLLVFKMSSF